MAELLRLQRATLPNIERIHVDVQEQAQSSSTVSSMPETHDQLQTIVG
jgi:hypothetical protein